MHNSEILDLFCGCGGLSLAAHMAGFDKSNAIDIDPDLTSSFLANFPSSQLMNGDLSKLTPQQIKRELDIKHPIGIIGGPPCQGFSTIGRQDKGDPRNRLLYSFFENVAFFRPKYFLMENVPGLMAPSNKNFLDRALNIVPGRYKILPPTILNAADFGAPTSRPRLVVIGIDLEYVDDFGIDDILRHKSKQLITVKDALWDLPILSSEQVEGEWRSYRKLKSINRYAKKMRRVPPSGLGSKVARLKRSQGLVSGCQLTHHTKEIIKRFKNIDCGRRDPISKYHRLSWNGSANVLRAGTGSDKGSYQAARPIHPDHPRVITVREAARIQGFPDWFQFHETKWHSHRMIGNSVSPVFAYSIFRELAARCMKQELRTAAE